MAFTLEPDVGAVQARADRLSSTHEVPLCIQSRLIAASQADQAFVDDPDVERFTASRAIALNRGAKYPRAFARGRCVHGGLGNRLACRVRCPHNSRVMSALNPTRAELLCDRQGRPYFLWDTDLTLARFRELLESADHDTQAYLIAKLMRQAKPDDVFAFTTLTRIREHWTAIVPQLGNKRAFWHWVLDSWRSTRDAV